MSLGAGADGLMTYGALWGSAALIIFYYYLTEMSLTVGNSLPFYLMSLERGQHERLQPHDTRLRERDLGIQQRVFGVGGVTRVCV